ncbi:coiled-coil domain-containing protein 60 [Tachyglossus aculeatus]|uniref:coiled-coil domain-containing protein 60 n=1 Tax=Tachyglossus aculeatus TaxID=9261 RepID=UPI0018F4CD0F|nr:coiled-coil domain-containing protein 60 [Tachyglossus aculeatus]
MAGAGGSLDPHQFVLIRPLPGSSLQGEKVQARSATVYTCREKDGERGFWENHRRRLMQQTQQGHGAAIWKPYVEVGAPLILEPKTLTLSALGQLNLEEKDEISPCLSPVAQELEGVRVIKPKVPKPPLQKVKSREKEMTDLKRDLRYTRQMINSVKQGQGYFSILKKENANRKKILQIKKEEEGRTLFRHPREDLDDESQEDFLNFFPTGEKVKRKREAEKDRVVRPFTPVHSSLVAPDLQEARVEPLFRQLCALHWLLEALTLDSNDTMKPLNDCWSPKDPGGGKSTLKKINKEKAARHKWEHFIMQTKVKRSKSQFFRPPPGRRLSWRLSCGSLPRQSFVPSPPTSLLSLVPSSEDGHSTGTQGGSSTKDGEGSQPPQTGPMPEEEPLPTALQTLLEMVHNDVRKSLATAERRKGSPVSSSPMTKETSQTVSPNFAEAESRPIPHRRASALPRSWRMDEVNSSTSGHRPLLSPKHGSPFSIAVVDHKETLCADLRAEFQGVAEEAAVSLKDDLEFLAKRREEKGSLKLRALSVTSGFDKDMEKMRNAVHVSRNSIHGSRAPKEDEEDHWYLSLLAKLPADLKNYHRARKILQKLEKFGMDPELRIRTGVFLKTLEELRTWELCSPDVAAAVEFVRENIVRMPEADYATWLRALGLGPTQPHTAPSCRIIRSGPRRTPVKSLVLSYAAESSSTHSDSVDTSLPERPTSIRNRSGCISIEFSS